MACELERHGVLDRIYTGLPAFKVPKGRVSPEKVTPSSSLHVAHAAAHKYLSRYPSVRGGLEAAYDVARRQMDRRLSRKLLSVDTLVAMSGSGLLSGAALQKRGGVYVCDRGSSHIKFQDRILREEGELIGFPFKGISAKTIDIEIKEYERANGIFAPSIFVRDSFISEGVPEEKLLLVPYGIDVSKFRIRSAKSEEFRVLFAGILTARKGVHYLLDAWEDVSKVGGKLVLAGAPGEDFEHILRRRGGLPDGVELLGHVTQDRLAEEMSLASVLVLPSIEDGFGLVMAQALACGTPVIASENTGARTLFEHGKEGFVGPIRSADFIRESLLSLMQDKDLLAEMSCSATEKTKSFSNSEAYGDRVYEALKSLHQKKQVGRGSEA